MTFKVYNLISQLNRIFNTKKYYCLRQYTVANSYNVLFFGSDNIALSSLKKVNELRKSDKIINRLHLVTSNTTKFKTVIEKYALAEEIKILTWPLHDLQAAEYHVGLIVAFGHLIKDDILRKFPLGMINVHPSLLPRWRGAAPIIYTLLHGDQVTGVSLMKIKADVFDIGEIISQRKVTVSKDIMLPELTTHLSDIGAEMLVDCLRNLPGSLKNAEPQSTEGVTYAKKINKCIREVKWTEMTAEQVYNLYRAIYGLYSLTTKFRDKEMKLFNAVLYNTQENAEENTPVGTLEYCNKTDAIRIVCKDKKYVYFKSVRIVGKREISAIDFYNGYIKNVPVEKRKYILS